MGIMITCPGYNNGHNNLVYTAHKNVSTHFTGDRIMHSKTRCFFRSHFSAALPAKSQLSEGQSDYTPQQDSKASTPF